ncbi:enoyl-CoA hydratase/isomerase family protein [Mycolicibacterium smegmatis]|uniref:enoyl-CoA hydratase/isomerase family protein n=1 Tax=Mycolicibacterium smegmatis TaxID=1772 RepID=UPI0005D91496|nr:enoyl-CoA hydratase/isomerase family protein [Mycolicibacterium smegmatis]MDF1898016.1 enoyl-CoA hydratase/isomerase family protein [Mycolicibacterium smegmatis]MDF1904957.1 enoyl-CoA hydratase/isomerase family protein [Mycolicibacterium smegmatis]MDF1916775.1 enoyl-CoA hydratase/isomerase family protein [Mycolicibacterium smegmatis]MDF1923291.1 enoyl-CoA hydratase/isomerase family protein [Mycolicibacterium smegmatis]UAK52742.1 enoyl-CoA hydratase/isomerase family protein [Mycolicibacteriu
MTIQDSVAQKQSEVRIQLDRSVLHVLLDRPRKRNALDLTMIRSISRAIDGRPTDTRVVVISGGAFFSAGADIATYKRGDQGEIGEITRAAGAVIDTMTTAPIPVIAAVEGMALGGGFELAMGADIVVAGESAKLGLPEVALGLIPGWGGTQRLSAQIGIRRAKQIIMLQQTISAEDACTLGLVNEVVPDGTSLNRALEMAHQLAASSATALAATKRLVSGIERNLAYSDERAALMELFGSPDGIEGVTAFVEKRPANFGR